MRKLLLNVIYGAICSLAVLIIGLFLPRRWFNPQSVLFREREWERGGRFYNKLYVGKWKSKLPDMSKHIKRLIAKRLTGSENAEDVRNLVAETCVAEAAHLALCVLSLGMVFIEKSVYGVMCAVIYSVGNVPYIIIQRYNRPRLMKMLNRIERRSLKELRE